jgi:CubicO group peptidase (beta-lactamase class C family)
MYTLLSYFPLLLLGIPFEQYVNDFITEPLGMLYTTYMSEVAEKTGNLADGMMRDGVNQTDDVFGVGWVRPIPYWDSSGGVGNSKFSCLSVAKCLKTCQLIRALVG